MVDLIGAIATDIAQLVSQQPRVLVAIDGPDTAGKSTLADNLVGAFEVAWVRASIDGFHRPREVRVRRGELSPVGYYYDSFDYLTLTEQLLRPFRTGANRLPVKKFDWRADEAVDQELSPVPERAVLVFDGVFLLRPELRLMWDLAVYLHVREDVVLRRALTRDVGVLGDENDVRERYLSRYLPGQALYRSECGPENLADVVVDNSDYANPVMVKRSARTTGHATPEVDEAE